MQHLSRPVYFSATLAAVLVILGGCLNSSAWPNSKLATPVRRNAAPPPLLTTQESSISQKSRADTSLGLINPDTLRDSVNVKDFGALGDGIADDTEAIQSALDLGRPIIIPATKGFYRITKPLKVSNSISGIGMPILRMVDPDGTADKICLLIQDYVANGLVVQGIHIDGGWDSSNRSGEQSHLIAIRSSSNVVVTGCWLENSQGDNVYVGLNNSAISENVTVAGNKLINPYRCNVAVVAGTRIKVKDNDIRKLNDYVSSIDIEPNNGVNYIVNDVEISGNRFEVSESYFVNLYSPQPSSGYRHTVKNISVLNNVGSARYMLRKSAASGSWENIKFSQNTYLGQSGGTVDARMVLLGHATGNGAYLKDVTISENIDRAGMANGGPTQGSSCSNVQGLLVANNIFEGSRSSGFTISGCPGAIFTNNIIKATISNALTVTDQPGVTNEGLSITSNLLENTLRIDSNLTKSLIRDNIINPPSGVVHVNVSSPYMVTQTIIGPNRYLGTGLAYNAGATARISPLTDPAAFNETNAGTYYDVSEPSKGRYGKGAVIWNQNVARGGTAGWICTKSGEANNIAWKPNTGYSVGTLVNSAQRVFRSTVAGTSALSGGPLGTSASIKDGSVTWDYVDERAEFTPFGPAIQQIVASSTLDFPAIASGSSYELKMGVVSAAVGDMIMLGPPPSLEPGLIATAYVSEPDVVVIRLANTSNATVDPSPANWRASIFR